MATATAAPPRSRRRALTGDKVDAVLQKDYTGYWLALNHHRTHLNQPFDFKAYPYLEAPLFDDAQVIVAMKSTQGGWTELLIPKALGIAERGFSVFWVLPTGVLKNRFVKNRFDRSVAFTRHYREMMRSEETWRSSTDRAASMSLKHYGMGALAFIGSNAMSGFGEFPADAGVVDESDYCEQDNLPMVEERLSNSTLRRRIYSSQPTISGRGISLMYKESDQRRWLLRAACGHVIRPDWFRHVVRRIDDAKYEVIDPEWESLEEADARMICDRCGKPVDRFSPGFWEVENPRIQGTHGYHFSKLFTTRMTINEMLDRFDKGLTSPEKMQRFENADLGEAHSAKGSKIQREDLEACVGDYGQGRCSGPVVVGVDVGALLHVAIGELLQDGSTRVMWLGTMAGTADNLGDLRELVARYRLTMGVIDELPERRMARRLAYSSRRWWMARYTEGKRDIPDPRAKIVSVDRTSALDAVNEAVMLGPSRLRLPADALGVEGFEDQMTTLTRVYHAELYRNEGGYSWDGDDPDHYMHALGYMLLARRMVVRR